MTPLNYAVIVYLPNNQH